MPLYHSIFMNCDTVIEDLYSDASDYCLNLFYSLNECYYNLQSQLAGNEFTFFINEAYESLYNYDSYEALIKNLEVMTKNYNLFLPKKIRSSYHLWKKSVNIEQDLNRTFFRDFGSRKYFFLLSLYCSSL